ncbi:hypothetical protein M9Y10_016506 [Tritrichomonas musculus]|uniref:Uncharacterized protein n=1 Tax=Tritrichomonas musculus TaxID=1915356 RepID=A0ABR2HX69_9EUKA
MLGLSICIILSLSITDEIAPRKHNTVSRIAHFECFNIVRLIEHEIRKIEGPFRRQAPSAIQQHAAGNATSTNGTSSSTQTGSSSDGKVNLNEIIQALSKNCDRLTDTRNAVCKDVLTEENVRKIYDFIKVGKRPDYICSTIGYKRVVPSTSRIINKKICKQVIDLIKVDFNRSITPFFGRHHFPGFSRFNSSLPGSRTKTNSTSKLLEDTQTTKNVTAPLNSSSHQGPFSHINKFSSFFNRKGPLVCRQFLDTPDYQQCLILSRIAIRTARLQIKAGNSSEDICDYLQSMKLIQLTEQDVGVISEERDKEQIIRNQRRRDRFSSGFRREDNENSPMRRHSRPDDENAPSRRHSRPDDENAPLRRHSRPDAENSRPKIERNN